MTGERLKLPGAFYLVVSILSSDISIPASHSGGGDRFLSRRHAVSRGLTVSRSHLRFGIHESRRVSPAGDPSSEIYFVLFFSPRAFVAITRTIREDAIPLAGRPNATFYREGVKSDARDCNILNVKLATLHSPGEISNRKRFKDVRRKRKKKGNREAPSVS